MFLQFLMQEILLLCLTGCVKTNNDKNAGTVKKKCRMLSPPESTKTENPGGFLTLVSHQQDTFLY